MGANIKNINHEKLISRYLLGDLPEEQQVEIEDRAFSDKDYLASIIAVENDLIDEYVRGELSAADRQLFESRFLASAERRKRVAFAKALRTVVSEAPEPEKKVLQDAPRWSWHDSLYAFLSGLNPAARLAFVAAAILLIVGAAGLVVETLRLRRQVNQLQAEKQSGQDLQQALDQERRRNEELNAQLNQEKQHREQTDEALRQLTETTEATNPARPVIASLTLLPGLSRGGDQKPNLDLSSDARLVRLQIGIDPEEQYKSFAVELRTLAGRHIWSREKLAARTRRGTRAVMFTLPATVLKSGEYELGLRGLTEGGGLEDVGFYYFNVRKR